MNRRETNIEAKFSCPPLALDPWEFKGSIPSRFERVAARYPQRTAVISSKHRWSYDLLNCTANQLARAILAQRGQGSEPVVLLFQHDAELISAILGVLKAGKFYVYLDPSFSQKWLSKILIDLGNPLTVCDASNLHLALELAGDNLQWLEYEKVVGSRPRSNVELDISAESPFGVFYTSGSTGTPKGVVRSHKLAINRAWVDNQYAPIFPDDRHSMLTSCMFAVSSTDIMGALLNGAALCMNDIRNQGLGRLAEWIAQEKITIFRPPVSLFRYFIKSLDEKPDLSKVRNIILSGAPVYRNDILNARPFFTKECAFVHRYAASEAGIVAHLTIRYDDEIRERVIPAGYPAAGKEILILDQYGRELDTGEIGEVAVRSQFLASGYWHQEAGHTDRFKDDPSGDRQRIYLTGDIGRLRPDGCLELTGRNKQLAKIRGYRVDLSLVESILRDQAGILDAAVVSKIDLAGENRLVAYLVGSCSPTPNASNLQKQLLEEIPDYMVPGYFEYLDRFPLTPNGKIDQNALPDPDWENKSTENEYQAPRTEAELMLKQIWCDSLNRMNIGINENFFHIGGDSLSASVVIMRIEQEFSINMPIQTFYEMPTIEDQAHYIDEHVSEPKNPKTLSKDISLDEKLRLLGDF